MTWNVHPTLATGSTFTAADQNTYVKGNLDILFPYSAGMQVAYSTSTVSLNKATSAGVLSVLRSNSANTAIEFGSMPIYARQTKTSTGTINSNATNTIIQYGFFTYSFSSDASISFPVPFISLPILMLTCVYGPQATYTSLTSTGFLAYPFFGSATKWIAVGEI
jgi:hypothetical protein